MEAPRRSLLPGVILIALGLLFLVANFISLQGWLFLGGLGLIFLIFHVFAQRYGWAIAGSLLVGLAAFTAIEENRLVPENQVPGVFFLILGASFLAIYFITRRWRLFWSLVTGGVLAAFGAALLAGTMFPQLPIQQLADLSRWWPVIFLVLGGWLLARSAGSADLMRGLGIAVGVVVGGLIGG